MNPTQSNEIGDVWSRIQGWPDQMRLSLASRILQSLQQSPPTRRKTLRDLVGLLATDQRPPTDEEVQKILEEHRTRKYG